MTDLYLLGLYGRFVFVLKLNSMFDCFKVNAHEWMHGWECLRCKWMWIISTRLGKSQSIFRANNFFLPIFLDHAPCYILRASSTFWRSFDSNARRCHGNRIFYVLTTFTGSLQVVTTDVTVQWMTRFGCHGPEEEIALHLTGLPLEALVNWPWLWWWWWWWWWQWW